MLPPLDWAQTIGEKSKKARPEQDQREVTPGIEGSVHEAPPK